MKRSIEPSDIQYKMETIKETETNINTESGDVGEICYFCHKPYDSTMYERKLDLPLESIHKSCCRHLKPEYLNDSFLSWDDNVPFPFCKKCLFCMQKLLRMSDKLEEIQKQIDRYASAFTVEFLKSRRRMYISKCVAANGRSTNETNTFHTADGLVAIKLEQPDEAEGLAESEVSVGDNEDIYSGYDSAEELHFPSFEMKEEVVVNPVVRRGRGRPRLSQNQKPRKSIKSRKRKSKGKIVRARPSMRVNRRRVDYDADGNPIPSNDSLPRRQAAVKAEATFLSWTEESLGVPENVQCSDEDLKANNIMSDESNSSWKMTKEKKIKIRKKQKRRKTNVRGRPPKHDPNVVDKVFKCKQCDKTYKNRHHLLEHEITHDKNRRFQCTLCDASFSYVRNLRKHLIRHDKNEPLDRRKNRKPGDHKEKKPLKARDGKPRSYVCKICTKVCNTAGHLFYHSQSHKNSDGEFKCDICNKVFKNAVTYQKHGKIHTGENKFLCSVCGKEFKSRSGQKDHELLHFEDKNERLNRKDFECQVCHKIYSSKSSLNKHSFRHNEEKQFACQECGKRFATKGGLQTHMIYHKGERPFLCEECGKSFFTKTKLNEHNRIHTGMLFPCEYCDKGFQTTTHLKQHYRSHNKKISETKETMNEQISQTFQCPTCDLKFDSQNTLSNHMVIHSEEFSRFLMFTN